MKKSVVLSTQNEFPKEFVLEDFLEKLIVIEKNEEGLKDIKSGKLCVMKSKENGNRWRK
ncbi:MAG: hypothetical protein M3Q56_05305 [Bacteroidota bacterium]|nr:hypothetical protein [Bacteroidota bacterium]